MGGNDTLTTSQDLFTARGLETFSAPGSQIRPIRPRIGPFMTPPVLECTCRELEKPEVWPSGAIPEYPSSSTVTLLQGTICNPPRAGYHPSMKIFFLF
jgi:hypothetical protein